MLNISIINRLVFAQSAMLVPTELLKLSKSDKNVAGPSEAWRIQTKKRKLTMRSEV